MIVQKMDDMRALPDSEKAQAKREMIEAINGAGVHGSKMPKRCIELDGCLRMVYQVGAWWYYPTTTIDGFRVQL